MTEKPTISGPSNPVDLSGLPKHLHGSCKPADLPLTGEQYQHLASRTECDQLRSRMRISGSLGHIKDPTNLPLLDGGPSNNSIPLIPIRFSHAVVGMAGEVGELSSLLERWVYYGKELDVNKVAEEVGDVLWYVAELCNTFGLNMSTIMAANIAKLKARYPDKYTDEQANTRDIKVEAEAMEQMLGRKPPVVTDVIVPKCHYCSIQARQTLVWLRDKQGRPAEIKLPWCGCDLMVALRKTYANPYQVREGVDYRVETLQEPLLGVRAQNPEVKPPTTEHPAGTVDNPHKHVYPMSPRETSVTQDGHGFGHSDPGEMSQDDGI